MGDAFARRQKYRFRLSKAERHWGALRKFAGMTVQQATARLKFQLMELYEERESANICDWVMESITGWTRIDRVVNKTALLSAPQEKRLEAITLDLVDHMPVQYALGEAWFYGLRLSMNKNVLIPRPETEELTDWIVKDLQSFPHQDDLCLLDIGTGSGCIPLGIKSKLPRAAVHAGDISEEALALAGKNAAALQLPIYLHRIDILGDRYPAELPLFDVIVSNPPYIPLAEKQQMAPNVVRYEPALALFVADNDPLQFYRHIAMFAKQQLKPGGYLYFEIHESMGDVVQKLLAEHGYSDIDLRKDLQGKDRMCKCVNE